MGINAHLDSGSTNTFCSDELIKELGQEGTSEDLSLTTLEMTSSRIQTIIVSVEVTDLNGEHVLELPAVYGQPKLPRAWRIEDQWKTSRSGNI